MSSAECHFRPSDNHWRVPGFKERITRKQLQNLLLFHPENALRKGDLYEWKNRSLGVGVYEIWLEKKPTL